MGKRGQDWKPQAGSVEPDSGQAAGGGAEAQDTPSTLAGVGTGQPVIQMRTCMCANVSVGNFSATASRETKESYQTTTREGKTMFFFSLV